MALPLLTWDLPGLGTHLPETWDLPEGAHSPPGHGTWDTHPLRLTSSCDLQNTDGWQAANTGQTGMLSCLSRYVPLPSLQKVEIRNFASKFQLKRSTLIHIGSTNTKQIWQGEQMTHVK